MKSFKEYMQKLHESDAPTNVSGSAVSTEQPVVGKKASDKYKKINNKLAGENETDISMVKRMQPN